MNHHLYQSYFFMLLLFAFSCSKKEVSDLSEEKDFIKIDKVTNVTSKSGRNRLELSWREPDNLKEIKLSKYRLYWNGGKDSLEVSASTAADSVLVLMNNLEEGSYIFSIYAYDINGNKSAAASGYGKVYGTQYEADLVNRPIKDAFFDKMKESAEIEWNLVTTGPIGTEIKYTDLSGKEQLVEVGINEMETKLDFKIGTDILYQTLYLPQANSLDTFSTLSACNDER